MRRLARCDWDRLALAGILAGAVARLLWVFVFHQPFDHVYSDIEGYVGRAKKLALGGPLEPYDGHYPIGTHVLLAIPFRLLGVGNAGLWGGAVLWWALSSATPFFIWKLARLLLTRAAAALTAVFCAAWPLFVTYAGFFSSETPSIAFLSAGLWLAYRARLAVRRGDAVTRGLGAGVVLGATVAVRAQFLLNLAIAALPLLRRRARMTLVALGAGTAVVLAAVIAHNSFAEKRLAGIDGHGGLVFFVGQCDVRKLETNKDGLYFIFGPPAAAQLERGREYRFEGHTVWEAGFFYKQGLKCIRDDGFSHLTVLTRSLANMTATTLPWPQSNEPVLKDVAGVSNFFYCFVLLPIAVVGGIGLIRRRRPAGLHSGEATMLAHLAMVVPVALISAVGEPRYRTVYDLFGLALLAAVVADRWLDPRSEPSPVVAPPG